MARRPAKTVGTGSSGLGWLIALLAVVAIAAGVWLPITIADPPGYHGEHNPIAVTLGVLSGRITWTRTCTLIAAVELAVLLAVGGGIGVLVWRRRRGRSRVDDAARQLATPRDMARLGPDGSAESARRLRPSLPENEHLDAAATGVLVGRMVVGGMPIRQSWEDMAVDIWGPRTGKTTARAIPAILEAPGPVLVTSVKGDIVDATRDLRARLGQVWIFDPQNLYRQPQQMWWDILEGVTTITRARRLAEHFAAGSRRAGAQADSYFDPAGEELTANLLLAAAVSPEHTALDAYRWAVSPADEQPALLLAKYGYDLPATSVRGVLSLPDRTRGGIYGGAAKNLLCLTEPTTAAWVTPPTSAAIPQFYPDQFVAAAGGRRDTLYLLSQGGPGSPAPLIAAFTDAVHIAGEAAAFVQPGHRLDPPVLSVLDEAANICRDQRLPDLYSFYGSLGMPIITILQSYPQGEDVWGREGMRKLWSAANVRTYGGGVADVEFLKMLSELTGPDWVTVRSGSRSTRGVLSVNDQYSNSWQPQQQPILDVAKLHALPLGRMLVLSSGNRPALLRTCPWQTGPYAADVQFSLRRWDRTGSYDTTLHDPDQPLQPLEPLQ